MEMKRLAVTAALAVLVGGCASSSDTAASSSSDDPTPTADPGYTQKGSVLYDAYAVSQDGRTLTFRVGVGGGCDETGTASAEVAESEGRVEATVYVRRSKSPVPPSGPCPANLVMQDATARLSEPLGDRQVFDTASGKALHRE